MALPAAHVNEPSAQLNFEFLGRLVYAGNGSPEGIVPARVGATYHRYDGGAGSCFYVKEANSGLATGWVAK